MSRISQIKSRLELQMIYDRLYTTRSRKPLLKSLILLSDRSPEDLHRLVSVRKKLRKNYTVEVEPLGNDLYHVDIEKHIWGKPANVGALIDAETRGCWIAYTDESGYFVRRILQPFIRGLYPYVARVYFNYAQIQTFLEAINKLYQGSSVVTHLAYKHQSRTGKGKPKGTRLLWEPEAEKDLNQIAQRDRTWIDNLTFEVKDREDTIALEASLTGTGTARLKFGTFSDFRRNVIDLYISLATEWRDFFSNRERRVEEGRVRLSPYYLQYGFDFEKPQFDELIADLKGAYSHSILVSGNPYFAANLTDYQDGSSFYLTILGGRVTITPMLRATSYALWQISARVQGVLGDGDIVDMPRQ